MSSMISILCASLVFIGLVIHLATLAPLRRLIAMLPAGSLRNKWLAMTSLILLFIVGYLDYSLVFWGQQSEFPPEEWVGGPVYVSHSDHYIPGFALLSFIRACRQEAATSSSIAA